jgi:hypothetical protein
MMLFGFLVKINPMKLSQPAKEHFTAWVPTACDDEDFLVTLARACEKHHVKRIELKDPGFLARLGTDPALKKALSEALRGHEGLRTLLTTNPYFQDMCKNTEGSMSSFAVHAMVASAAVTILSVAVLAVTPEPYTRRARYPFVGGLVGMAASWVVLLGATALENRRNAGR